MVSDFIAFAPLLTEEQHRRQLSAMSLKSALGYERACWRAAGYADMPADHRDKLTAEHWRRYDAGTVPSPRSR